MSAEHTPPPAAESDPDAAEKDRRRRVLIATLLLLIGLPLYILVAGSIVGALTEPQPSPDGSGVEKPLHWALELLIYIILGVIWAFPLKGLVQGTSKKS